MSKVKKHPSLSTITGALSGRLPEVVAEVLGVQYRLRLLKPEAEDWVAMNTPGNTISAALLNSRKPTIAASLVGITLPGVPLEEDAGPPESLKIQNEMSVESLFKLPDDMPADEKQAMSVDSKRLRDWRREQILEWLREEQDVYVIDKLYDAYQTLIPKHKEAMQTATGF